MKKIERLMVLWLMIGSVLPALQAQSKNSDSVVIAYLYDVAGQHKIKLEWRISSTILEKQPQWDGLSTNPPLASGAAASIALQKVQNRFPDIKDWTVETIYLRNLFNEKTGSFSCANIWRYQITIVPKDEAVRSKLESEGLDHEFTQVILMDRTVVVPVVVPTDNQ